MRLGSFEIFALSDGGFALDGGQMFGVVPKPLWEKKMAADARNRIRLGLTCLLIKTGKRNILVETGIGDKFDARHTDIYGVDHGSSDLMSDLERHGTRSEDIDLVINTHLHFDHCGWNVRREGSKFQPSFPRARYFVQRGEWDHGLGPTERDRGSYIEEFFAPAESQTEFLNGDAEIAPGVSVEVVPGHTHDMQAVRICSEGAEAYFISDILPTCAHLPYSWMMSFDLYPLETLANKKRLMPRLAAERTLVIFPHDPAVPWARLVEQDGRFTAIPANED